MRGVSSVRIAAVAACLVLGAGEAAAQTQLARTVARDRESILAVHVNLNPDCTQGAPVGIVMMQPPANGAIRVAREIGPLDRSLLDQGTSVGNIVPCVGARLRHVVVRYRPRRGFSGEDRVVYERRGGRAQQTITIAITVR